METHGEKPKQNVIAVIPARYSSTRLEGKLLLPLNGKPLILHTLERARMASNVSRVIVATDDDRIKRVVTDSGGEAVMTSVRHQSGSDRIAEVAVDFPDNTIVVNVQGDEPLISPLSIELAVEALRGNEEIDIATTCEKISEIDDVLDPDVVKVVRDTNGKAIYFSRSPIPYPREAVGEFGSLAAALKKNPALLSIFRKHTGLYVYRREYLLKYAGQEQALLEGVEHLEQLRALETGARIMVVEVEDSSIGVDTQEDFDRVAEIMSRQPELV